ncbi:intraflagellar transport 80 [Thecamonas trahens ATCC 50062]|uniref:Intraflagellar transport 80 n=1 Tax=Thecamonas trahens ATCC 50062 TaxID=461836 RepID=A0A0L0DPG2_THETB|nr:intraflagellar transport 80 [Thecamonas trahens ATCC 50062]KNC54194.1 intraflagellar transport 80 [Thecamonas trahens ATCC 50062]|eukprot:XP_013753835.1 intraflagellar transport 80 [Thecamonas trahens ATCC 50062]
MKLVTYMGRSGSHTAGITGVGWASDTTVVSVADDGALREWNAEGEPLEAVLELDGFYATCMALAPPAVGGASAGGSGSAGAGKAAGPPRAGVVGTSDGALRLFSTQPKWESAVEGAHEGAVLDAAYTRDGATLATCGEDGALKVWSRAGVLRSVLYTQPRPVYALAWGSAPGSNGSSAKGKSKAGASRGASALALTSGASVVVKPLDPAGKVESWKAHDGLVLALDWSPVSDLIVSGGEDARYKVWDAFGRPLYASSPFDHVVTSARWAPDGTVFAVGAFELLALCDAAGWIHARAEAQHAGSLQALAWSPDSSHVVGAGAGAELVLGYVTGRHVEWRNYDVTLIEPTKVRVLDVANEFEEELVFRDRVIKLSLAADHLVAATTHQVYIYSTSAWSTPVIIEAHVRIDAILQCAKYFALLDSSTGLAIHSYDGRPVMSPKIRLAAGDVLTQSSVALSPDTVALIDPSARSRILLFDAGSGRVLDDVVGASRDVVHIALSQVGSPADRKLVYIDSAGELFMTSVVRPAPVRLAAMASSVVWNECADMLVAYCDSSLVTWYYPGVVFVASSLTDATKTVDSSVGTSLGRSPTLLSFVDTHVSIRTQDGALAASMDAVNLCRFVNQPLEWAILAALAVAHKELGPAEIAFAQVNQVDKLEHIARIAAIDATERRHAELALFCGKPDEAEAGLLQARLFYWAVELNMRLFNWPRALEIAQKHDPSLEAIVCLHRSEYLADFDRAETDEAFLAAAARVDADPDEVRAAEAALAGGA